MIAIPFLILSAVAMCIHQIINNVKFNVINVLLVICALFGFSIGIALDNEIKSEKKAEQCEQTIKVIRDTCSEQLGDLAHQGAQHIIALDQSHQKYREWVDQEIFNKYNNKTSGRERNSPK